MLVLCALAGCSKAPSAQAVLPARDDTAPSVVAEPKARAAHAPVGNACDRHWLTIADAADILREPVVGARPLSGDPQTCDFITATQDAGGPSIRVSVRPGLGRATVTAWSNGSMPFTGSPVPGVGDSAVWISSMREINAQQHDVLCDIAATGLNKELLGDPSGVPRRLGALCKKIFALAAP